MMKNKVLLSLMGLTLLSTPQVSVAATGDRAEDRDDKYEQQNPHDKE
jgi:hypothetical protein